MNTHIRLMDMVLNKILVYTMVLILALPAFVSCKKEISSPTEEPAVERTTNQLVMDSLFYYFKEQSYWTNSVEAVNPLSRFTDRYFRSNADLITNANAILAALKAQTPFHAGYNGPLDRFSFVEDVSSGSNALRADKSDGYGIFETIVRINDAPTGYIYISFVEGGSPAARAGLQRGDKIVAVNDNSNLEVPLSGNTPTSQTAIQAVTDALNGSTLAIKIERAGEILTYNLQYATYDIDPLLADTIFELPGKKVGYFALSSFEQTRGAAGNVFRTKLDAVFSNFEHEQVEDIIVDFRYNVGGYVHAAEYLANKLINNEGNGKLMYKSETNPALQQGRYARDFVDVNFTKNSTINPRKIYFLVSRNTASASELVINALMAYYNPLGNDNPGTRHLEIIGTPESIKAGASIPSTYGKPVGFFPETIMDKIDLWAASFKIVNARDYTDYWDGIPATNPNPVQDNVLVNFGDPRESMIDQALYHSINNQYRPVQRLETQARSATGGRINMDKTEIIKELNPRPPRELKKYR